MENRIVELQLLIDQAPSFISTARSLQKFFEEGEERDDDPKLDELNAQYVHWFHKALKLLHSEAIGMFRVQYTDLIRGFLQNALGINYRGAQYGKGYISWTYSVEENFVSPIRSQVQLLRESLARYELGIGDLDGVTDKQPIHPDEPMAKVEVEGDELTTPLIFVGHGHGDLYLRVVNYLDRRLKLKVDFFEDEVRAGFTNIEVVQSMLANASFAVIVATADDTTDEGTARARQNVVHEIGLFQGKLGFRKVAVLKQNGTEEFSNLAGYQELRFDQNNINAKFEELRQMLVREGMLTH